MTVESIRIAHAAGQQAYDEDVLSPPEAWYFEAIAVLLAEVDRLWTQPPGIARIRVKASWLEPRVGSLFRRGETEADGQALDWVWLDDDWQQGRGAETIVRGLYEIIED